MTPAIWFGVVDKEGTLYAVEEGVFAAGSIASRFNRETKSSDFSVREVGIVPVEIVNAIRARVQIEVELP